MSLFKRFGLRLLQVRLGRSYRRMYSKGHIYQLAQAILGYTAVSYSLIFYMAPPARGFHSPDCIPPRRATEEGSLLMALRGDEWQRMLVDAPV